jgi:hypothetical protein
MDPGRTFELEFAKFIERFHEEIREAFLEDAFHKRDMLSKYERGRQMLEELSHSVLRVYTTAVDRKTPVETIADKYVQLGMHCCRERISCSEMAHALILLKRHIWLFFQESNFAGQPFDIRSVVALNNRTALYFDRAIRYFLVGYEQACAAETAAEPRELEKLYNAFLAKIRRDLAPPTEHEKTE